MLGFLAAFIITIVLEAVVALFLLRRRYDVQLIIRNVIIASTLTLPFVWFVFPNKVWLEYSMRIYFASQTVLPVLGLGSWILQTTLAEIFAFGIETIVYRFLFNGMSWRGAIVCSFIANFASFSIGLVLPL